MAKKKKKAGKSHLYDALTPLSGKDFQSTVNAFVNAQLKPQLSSLTAQQHQAQNSQKMVMAGLSGYMDQLAKQQLAVQGAANAGAEASAARQQAIGQQSASQLAQAAQQAQARLDAARATQGGGFAGVESGADQVAQHFAQTAAGAANRSGADALNAANRTAAGQTAIAGMATAGNQRGMEIGGDVSNAFAKIIQDVLQKKADVNAQRPALTGQALMQLRDSEFNKVATMEGLGIDREKIAASTATANAKIAETNRHNQKMERDAHKSQMLANKKFRLDREKHGYTVAKENYQREHGLGPFKPSPTKNGGLSPSEQRRKRANTSKFFTQVDDAVNNLVPQIRDAIKKNNAAAKAGKKDEDGDPYTAIPWNDQTLRAALRKKGIRDPLVIDAILYSLPSHGGKIPPSLMKKIRAQGMGVPKGRRGVGKPKGPVEQKAHDLGSVVGGVLGALFG